MITVNAMKNVVATTAADFEFKGLSTDEKPVGTIGEQEISVNSLFLELDTGDFYYYNGETWTKIGE